MGQEQSQPKKKSSLSHHLVSTNPRNKSNQQSKENYRTVQENIDKPNQNSTTDHQNTTLRQYPLQDIINETSILNNANNTTSIKEPPHELFSQNQSYVSNQQLKTKKQPTIDFIKKMKQRNIEDEISPITIRKQNLTDREFISQQQSFYDNNNQTSNQNSNQNSNMPYSDAKSFLLDDNDKKSELYEYYLKYQQEKKDQYMMKMTFEPQIQAMNEKYSSNLLDQDKLAEFIKQQVELAQLKQENEQLKYKLSLSEQQQMIQQQVQQQVAAHMRMNTVEKSQETTAPIVINNNIVSPENYKKQRSRKQSSCYCGSTDQKRYISEPVKAEQSISVMPDSNKSKVEQNQVKEVQEVQEELSLQSLKSLNLIESQEDEKQVESQKQIVYQREEKEEEIQQESLETFFPKKIEKKEEPIIEQKKEVGRGIRFDFNFDSEKKEKKSLADCFMNRKKSEKIIRKTTLEREEEEEQRNWIVNVNKRSKEEQLRLRKEMLNYGRRKTQEKVVVNEDKLVKEKSKSVIKSGPSSELMERLATGGKAKVNEKDMYKLTRKNYEKLPEIKAKKEQAMKKQEKNQFWKERQNKIKELDEKVKNKLFKKK